MRKIYFCGFNRGFRSKFVNFNGNDERQLKMCLEHAIPSIAENKQCVKRQLWFRSAWRAVIVKPHLYTKSPEWILIDVMILWDKNIVKAEKVMVKWYQDLAWYIEKYTKYQLKFYLLWLSNLVCLKESFWLTRSLGDTWLHWECEGTSSISDSSCIKEKAKSRSWNKIFITRSWRSQNTTVITTNNTNNSSSQLRFDRKGFYVMWVWKIQEITAKWEKQTG